VVGVGGGVGGVWEGGGGEEADICEGKFVCRMLYFK
jgi:hypothetical protein